MIAQQHTAVSVADKIIQFSLEEETPITPMQVQKLTYFCHAWMLGLGYGPLFRDAVESWRFGPVIRELYHSLKHYGGDRVASTILERAKQPVFNEREEQVIRAVWEQYRHLDGITLSRMTHAPGSPWDEVHQCDKRSQIIHNHVIRDYYAAIIAQRRAS